MTAAGVQTAIRWAKGELEQTDLLGSSAESAIDAVNKWIYDLDHPLACILFDSLKDLRQCHPDMRECPERGLPCNTISYTFHSVP